jgi:hypothetical protein
MEQMVQLCEAVAMVHEELLSSVVRDSPPDDAPRHLRDGRPPLTRLLVRGPELLQLLDGLRPMFDRGRLEQRLA